MAGRGPTPKDPRRRARRNADQVQGTVIRFTRGVQPELPEEIDWPERTRAWWQMWAESPMAEHFMASDWDFLLDTALLHRAVWGFGDFGKLSELRIRVALFGQTPADRARLRIQFAEADDADGGQSRTQGQSARDRRGPLQLVPPVASGE